jgi:hypothetical protein
MLSDDLARYVALHEAMGFSFRTQRILLRMFVAYAECEFRFNPATDSDLKPAGVPI